MQVEIGGALLIERAELFVPSGVPGAMMSEISRKTIYVLAALLWLTLAAAAQWQPQTSGTSAGLRGLSVVGGGVAWASGTGGTYLRTEDGGYVWQVGVVPGGEQLDFRDVEAFSPQTALLLSSGLGELSRIYKTSDGGAHWSLKLTNPHPQGFFDGMAFWDKASGIAFSDPVDGRFPIFLTNDGGETWNELPRDRQPQAVTGEAAFAASGTSLIAAGVKDVYFATGGAAARVFHSENGGRTWSAAETPMAHGRPSAGIFRCCSSTRATE